MNLEDFWISSDDDFDPRERITVASYPPDAPPQEEIDRMAREQVESARTSTKGNGKATFSDMVRSYDDLLRDNPELRPSIIEGILRRGEICNIIAQPKMGKSWLVHSLLIAAAERSQWLGYQTLCDHKVLLVDNELHPETLASRLRRVRYAMNADDRLVSQNLDVMPVRGRNMGLGDFANLVAEVPKGTYDLICLDAFYRFLPKGTNENDNADIMALYNKLDEMAEKLNASIVVIHHSSKGDQAGKSVTDVGSGAGSQSRATDTHLVIRPHEEQGLAVLDGALRSNAPIEPRTLRWDFPLWKPCNTEPVLRRAKPSGEVAQAARDAEADKLVLDTLQQANRGRLTYRKLRSETGFGPERMDRSLARLRQSKSVTVFDRKLRGSKKAVKWVSLREKQDENQNLDGALDA